jgi:ribosome-binding factor A
VPNRRIERVNELVREELAQLIARELRTPLPAMVSITEVDITPDLKMARVYVSLLGSDQDQADTFNGLRKAAGFLRHLLAERISLRYTPELVFVKDDSIERGSRILGLIRQIEADDSGLGQNQSQDESQIDSPKPAEGST